jgi:hypothetical protein
MTVFIAGRTPVRIFHEMTGENPREKKYRGNDLHMEKTVRYCPGPMTSSNSLVARSSQAKISQHNSRRYYQ